MGAQRLYRLMRSCETAHHHPFSLAWLKVTFGPWPHLSNLSSAPWTSSLRWDLKQLVTVSHRQGGQSEDSPRVNFIFGTSERVWHLCCEEIDGELELFSYLKSKANKGLPSDYMPIRVARIQIGTEPVCSLDYIFMLWLCSFLHFHSGQGDLACLLFC